MVLTDTNLVTSAFKWTLDYLRSNIGDGSFSVYESRTHFFKYFDDKKQPAHPDFKPQMKRLDMTFGEFCDRLKISQRERRRYVIVSSIEISQLLIRYIGTVVTVF